MHRIKVAALALVLSLGAFSAWAADFDGSKALLCATMTINECVPAEGCERVTAESVGAPLFFRIDFASKTIQGVGEAARERKSEIKQMATIDDKLFLQGSDDGIEGVRDGLGWTLSIAQDTGRLTASASGDQVGFVIFGACTPQTM